MTDKDYEYIDGLKIKDIPWIRFATPYGRAEKFPEYFQSLNSDNKEIIDKALQQIAWNVEHQDTLWPVTPVAMVFLARIFKDKIKEATDLSYYIAERLLKIFILVADSCQYADEMEHTKPLSAFSDMLSEEALWPEVPEDYDDEVDMERYEEGPFSDELFYSFYYYSRMVLARIRLLTAQLESSSLKADLDRLFELL